MKDNRILTKKHDQSSSAKSLRSGPNCTFKPRKIMDKGSINYTD